MHLPFSPPLSQNTELNKNNYSFFICKFKASNCGYTQPILYMQLEILIHPIPCEIQIAFIYIVRKIKTLIKCSVYISEKNDVNLY